MESDHFSEEPMELDKVNDIQSCNNNDNSTLKIIETKLLEDNLIVDDNVHIESELNVPTIEINFKNNFVDDLENIVINKEKDEHIINNENYVKKSSKNRISVSDSDGDDKNNVVEKTDILMSNKNEMNDNLEKEKKNCDDNLKSAETIKKKSRLKFYDTDSSDDENKHENSQQMDINLMYKDNDNSQNIDNNEQFVNNNKKSRKRIVDSDDDDQTDQINNLNEKESFDSKNNKNSLNFLDTDSSDNEITYKNSEQIDPEKVITFSTDQTESYKSRLSTLIDSESSDDEQNTEKQTFQSNYEEPEDTSLKLPKSAKNKEKKPKKMTGKEAEDQRRQITSESQRMLRETRVSLPYHRAKSYTLQEFLSKRSSMTDIIRLTSSVPNHLSIKMSAEQLKLAARQLEEREKELDEFYKSNSESDNDDLIQAAEVKNNDTNKENSKNEEKNEIENKEIYSEKEKEINIESEENKSIAENVEDIGKENEQLEKDITEIETISEVEAEIKNKSEENIETLETELLKLIENDNYNNKEDRLEDDINNIIEKLNSDQKENDVLKDDQLDDQIEKVTNDLAETNKEKSEIEEQVDIASEIREKSCTEKKLEAKTGSNKILEKLKKLNPLLAMKTDFQPRITGNSKDVIVLDDDIEKSKGINELKKRFMVHNAMKPVHTKDESDIMGIDTNVLKHESAKVLIDHDDANRVVELKPGAKLKKLRQELETQMAKRRLEQWEKLQKENEEKKEDFYEGEKEECGIDLDDDKEEEMTETESSDEDEEEDMEIEERPREKSAFVDDEADESEREGNEDDDDDDEDDEDDEDEENDADVEDNTTDGQVKPLKRIIMLESDDSHDEFNSQESEDLSPTDDEEIPVYQKEKLNKTPLRGTQSTFDLNLTPVSCLTALQTRQSTSKSIPESPVIPLSLPQEPSPLRKHPGIKTKLFETVENEGFTQAFDELEGLCSGKFIEIPQDVNTQDNEILDIVTEKFDMSDKKKINTSIDLTYENSNDKIIDGVDLTNENSSNDSLKFISSKKLADDIMGESKKKKVSVLTSDQNQASYLDFDYENSQDIKLTLDDSPSDNNELTVETEKGKLVIISSDDEVQELVSPKKKKSNLKKKLDFSDDEQSDTDRENDIEELTDDEKTYETLTNLEVNYDSEENEIEFDENEEIVTEKVAKTFFEAEAELSESEWGSEDEDEKDLDELEMEAGDAEQYNESKLQKEIGKIHMRQVLDQDNREVRLLQEMLLEDGELHGVGREKKFKWKNADSLTWNDTDKQQDEEDETEEIENELQWRKMRHEREVFLEEQRKKALENTDEVDLLATDSHIMQLGKEVLKKSQDLLSEPKPPVNETLTFSLLNKRSFRGSFLTRSEYTLSRLAEMTKDSGKEILAGPKNSRNFLFTTVSKNDEIEEDGESNEKKRKAVEGTPKILKKMRISEPSTSGVKSKKSLKSVFSQT